MEKEKEPDVVLLHGPTEDGEGARVLRARRGAVEAGEVRPLKEGKPLGEGEVVTLHPRPGAPCVCDVKVDYAPAPKRGSSGPPQVASSAYRDHWERIFGKRKPADAAN
jgi:hypothetical protein